MWQQTAVNPFTCSELGSRFSSLLWDFKQTGQIDSILKLPSVLQLPSWSQTSEAGAGLAWLLERGVNPAGRWTGERGCPRGRSQGGAWAGPVTLGVGRLQGLDLSFSRLGPPPPAPAGETTFLKGGPPTLHWASLVLSRGLHAQLVSKWDPSSPELRATFPLSPERTAVAWGPWPPQAWLNSGPAPRVSAERTRRSLSARAVTSSALRAGCPQDIS